MKELLTQIKDKYPKVWKSFITSYAKENYPICTKNNIKVGIDDNKILFHDLECFFEKEEIYIETVRGMLISACISECWCYGISLGNSIGRDVLGRGFESLTETKKAAILKAAEILEKRLT